MDRGGARAPSRKSIPPAFPASLLLLFGALAVVARVPQNPASVLGLALGAGSAFFFLLSYAYPIRKHLKLFSSVSLSSVLRFHTTATVVGATLAILHAGLNTGPNVATAAVVIMAVLLASGLFGNYLYVHAIALSEKAASATQRISAVIRVPEALIPSRKGQSSPARATDSGRGAAASSGRFARALAVWRIVHASVSYFFLLIIVAHVVVALCYRSRALWSLASGSP